MVPCIFDIIADFRLKREHSLHVEISEMCIRDRSYGVILPSSLTMLLPSALGFSPHPPVSVYGTGTIRTIAAFLDAWLTYFPTRFRSASRLRIALRFFLQDSYLACTRLSIPRLCSPHVSPQFCLTAVQESQPVVHRLRLSSSP